MPTSVGDVRFIIDPVRLTSWWRLFGGASSEPEPEPEPEEALELVPFGAAVGQGAVSGVSLLVSSNACRG